MKHTVTLLLLFICFSGLGQGEMLLASIQQAGGCTPDPNEQNTTANATSDPNCNETDGTAGWTNQGVGATMESQETDVHTGTSAMQQDASASTVCFMYYSLSVTSGDTFTVTFWAKSTQGSLERITAWTNVSGGPSSVNPTGTWTEYTYNITATATGTAQLRFYSSSSTSGVAGDNIIVDNMSIVKTNFLWWVFLLVFGNIRFKKIKYLLFGLILIPFLSVAKVKVNVDKVEPHKLSILGNAQAVDFETAFRIGQISIDEMPQKIGSATLRYYPANVFNDWKDIAVYATYFVSTTGNSGNAGTTEGAPWPLEYAFETGVSAGDIVYVKAGHYSDLILNTAATGTLANPIKFIGYTTTPGDIAVVNDWPSFSYSDYDTQYDLTGTLPTNVMPLLRAVVTNNDPDLADKAILIDQPYWTVENFMVEFYWEGIIVDPGGDNSSVVNCVVHEIGIWNPAWAGWNGTDQQAGDEGYGIYVENEVNNASILSCQSINVGLDCYFLRGDNMTLSYLEAHIDRRGNPADYMINIYGASGGTASNLLAIRHEDRDDGQDLGHRSRGISCKCATTGMIFSNIEIIGTGLQVYQNASDNTFSDFTVTASPGATSTTFTGQIVLADVASTNTFNRGYTEVLTFADFSHSHCIGNGDTYSGGPTGNIFNNVIVKHNGNSTYNGALDIGHSLITTDNSTISSIGTNTLNNCLLIGFGYLVQSGLSATFNLNNVNLVDIPTGLKYTRYTNNGTITINADYFNQDNNWGVLSGTNRTALASGFTNKAAGDFTLLESSGLKDAGKTISGVTTDFTGTTWSNSPPIGPYDFFVAPPDGEFYYISPTGDSGNTGLTEGSPWDFAYAITQALPGDVFYVKKGVYNRSTALSISQDGTYVDPIQFIGYDTTINDIISEPLSTIDFGMTTADTNMPVITRSGGTEDTDAFYINGDYIQLKNIVVTGFNFGFVGNGNNGLLDNVGFFELGPQTGDVYKGFGVRVIGNDWVVKNSYGQNVSAEAFLARGNNNTFSYNEYYSDVVGAQTDYYMTVRATTTENGAFNVFEGNRIYRNHDGSHAGHGYDIKSGNNNIYRDNYAYRTKLELTFSDTFDNQFLRNFVEGSTARIHITNGAHDNLFDGNIVLGSYQGILGEMYDDGAASPPTDCDCVGDNNIFVNNIVAGSSKAVQIQETIGNIVGTTPVIGWVFKNNTFHSNGTGAVRTNIDIEDWVFENNTWSDQTASGAINYFNSSGGTNVTFNKENYYNNSFATPSGAGFTNITAHDPMFTDALTNDFTLQEGSLLIDLGATTIYTTDIIGTERPQGAAFDIGAYEYISDVPGVTLRPGSGQIRIGGGYGKIIIGN